MPSQVLRSTLLSLLQSKCVTGAGWPKQTPRRSRSILADAGEPRTLGDGQELPRGVEADVGDRRLGVEDGRENLHVPLSRADADAARLLLEGDGVNQGNSAVSHADRQDLATRTVVDRPRATRQMAAPQLHSTPQRPDTHCVVVPTGGELAESRMRREAPQLAFEYPQRGVSWCHNAASRRRKSECS
eukprot:scaffold770_cov255-Pinguiococcus_pyrenoidosus.AAC.58